MNGIVRTELIYRYYKKYPSKQALGFCCSKKHAEEMAEAFCRRGILAAAVYSDGEYAQERQQAVENLKEGKIRVIFAVDMFNEGLDIPSVDMVMFLRPTESPVVFLQQLGRGLRQDKGKEYLNVLDFIGNYRKAGLAPWLLSGHAGSDTRQIAAAAFELEYPDDCVVDFDMGLIDLFQELSQRQLKASERILQEYLRIKEAKNGEIPSRCDLFTDMADEVYQYCRAHGSMNPCRNYLAYLQQQGDLTSEEEEIFEGTGGEFLHLLETTNMQKSYKMIVLSAFYNDGKIRMALTAEQLLKSWKQFFETGTNWKDYKDVKTYQEFRRITDQQHLSCAKQNPVHYLKKSGKGFFVEKEGYVLALREDLSEVIQKEAFRKHMKDIIEYRTMEYYRSRYSGEEVQ